MSDIIRVVVSEPDTGQRELLTAHLSVDGRFQVVGDAGGGNEVLRVALARAPDAVILDYLSVNPTEVLPALKQSLPEVTIICCSERNGHLQDQAMQLGADAFISKTRTITDDVVSAIVTHNPGSQEWE